MFSVNQMSVYHTLIEAYGVIRNSTSDQIKAKWLNKDEKYTLRSITNNDLKIPDKPKCIGFTYTGSKLFNKLSSNIKETATPNTFKTLFEYCQDTAQTLSRHCADTIKTLS